MRAVILGRANARREPIGFPFLANHTGHGVEEQLSVVVNGRDKKERGSVNFFSTSPFSLPLLPFSGRSKCFPAGRLPFRTCSPSLSFRSLPSPRPTCTPTSVSRLSFSAQIGHLSLFSDPPPEHVRLQRHRPDLPVRQPARRSVDRLHL